MTIKQIIQLSQMGLTAEQIEQVSQSDNPIATINSVDLPEHALWYPEGKRNMEHAQPEQTPAPVQQEQTPAPAQIPEEFATAMAALSGQIDRLTAAMRNSNITNSHMPPQPSSGDTAAAYLANIIAPTRKE